MLPVKFNYAAPFSLLKLFQSWFHPSARSFDLLATFLLVFCVFGYLTFLPFVRETFLILWNVKRGIFLRLLFIAVYWNLTQCFCSVSHRRSFSPHYCHEQSHCVHLKVLQVSGFLFLFSTGSNLLWGNLFQKAKIVETEFHGGFHFFLFYIWNNFFGLIWVNRII